MMDERKKNSAGELCECDNIVKNKYDIVSQDDDLQISNDQNKEKKLKYLE